MIRRNEKDLSIKESDKIELFSIYNTKDSKGSSRLKFLEGDKRLGWNAQRNLMKCLNHLELLRKKEEISNTLSLNSETTPINIFRKNYKLLEKHQKGTITTENVINQISLKRNLTKTEIDLALHNYLTVGHLEFHPSDICNLRCKGCTYSQNSKEFRPKQICYPFNDLDKLTLFQPRSILLSGGGEPTLYSDSTKSFTFSDLVLRIKEILPDVRLALVTNGTYRVPEDDWTKYMDWIRISIDAATPETFGSFRGKKNLYRNVIENLIYYLETPVKYIGASFLYSQENITEYANFALKLFTLIRDRVPQHMNKFNIQYRPLRKDPKDANRDFPHAITDYQIDNVVNEILEIANASEELENFLRNQTNIEAVLGGNTHPPHDFSRCYYSQIFNIIRTN
ncbi:MAG: radical SAM protein, partial [Candidatus Hodarchaeales archaeon]